MITTARLASPIGIIALESDEQALLSVRILPGATDAQDAPDHAVLGPALAQLRAYFAGARDDFDLPLKPLPTPRGEALRAAIASVPYGETLTYGALARQFESAPRAVGQACKRNPYPIIIPCHRVTTANGPEHYSGGAGISTKAWLLDFEQQGTRLL